MARPLVDEGGLEHADPQRDKEERRELERRIAERGLAGSTPWVTGRTLGVLPFGHTEGTRSRWPVRLVPCPAGDALGNLSAKPACTAAIVVYQATWKSHSHEGPVHRQYPEGDQVVGQVEEQAEWGSEEDHACIGSEARMLGHRDQDGECGDDQDIGDRDHARQPMRWNGQHVPILAPSLAASKPGQRGASQESACRSLGTQPWRHLQSWLGACRSSGSPARNIGMTGLIAADRAGLIAICVIDSSSLRRSPFPPVRRSPLGNYLRGGTRRRRGCRNFHSSFAARLYWKIT